MSLIRQVGLLLLATLLAALGASVGVSIGAAREALQTQLRLKNADNATALAQLLSQQHGERGSMRLAAAAQFDLGAYRLLRLREPDGRTSFERSSPGRPARAPDWFVRLWAIDAPPAQAQLSDGWREAGSIELASQTAWAHDELWRGALHSLLAFGLIGIVAGALAGVAVGRIRRPLDAVVAQADALRQGVFRSVAEPRAPELRRLTQAMNALVERIRVGFEAQAAHVEILRRQADLDPLTGLSNRRHFAARLATALAREDGPAACGLVLLRLARLPELNVALGHDRVDRLLAGIAETVQAYEDRAPGAFCGRLNGADIALVLPEEGVALETAQAIAGLLRAAFAEAGTAVSVAIGAVEAGHERSPRALLAAADLALARAESGPPYGVEAAAGGDEPWSLAGERGWRTSLQAAIDRRDAALGSFPVVDAHGDLVHLECPLRLRLESEAPHVVAARWLPLAQRARLTAEIDALAVGLALDAIARDGRPRAVNVAPATLLDRGFSTRLAQRLQAAAGAASQLWLEVPERAAVEHFDAVREIAGLVRRHGARFGLEHAGERLTRIERLFESGIAYVKLDAAVGFGLANDPSRRPFVAGLVALLHGLAIEVMAEGVADAADAAALFAIGVDAVTGPGVDATFARSSGTGVVRA